MTRVERWRWRLDGNRWCFATDEAVRQLLKMGHQKKKNTFKSSDPDRPGTNFAFLFFSRPFVHDTGSHVKVIHIYTFQNKTDRSRWWSLRSLYLVAYIRLGTCYAKQTHMAHAKVLFFSFLDSRIVQFEFLFFLFNWNSIPLPSTCLTAGRSLIRFDPSF